MTTKLERLKASGSRILASRQGVDFYECPAWGDMEPMLAVHGGRVYSSEHYEMLTAEDMPYLLESIRQTNITLLMRQDSNGFYSDSDSRDEGCDPLTLAETVELLTKLNSHENTGA